jgi:hypothetical protein
MTASLTPKGAATRQRIVEGAAGSYTVRFLNASRGREAPGQAAAGLRRLAGPDHCH